VRTHFVYSVQAPNQPERLFASRKDLFPDDDRLTLPKYLERALSWLAKDETVTIAVKEVSEDVWRGLANPRTKVIEGVQYAGHRYTVIVEDGRIKKLACAGRFPLTDATFIGDDGWLVASLEHLLGLGESATK
jgi:hypothetical protein